MIDLMKYLSENSYPGRGIVLGRTADNKKAAIAYFIMGRSENSRNRVFEATEDGIRTRAFDESKMTDPSLIIYHPVRLLPNGLLVVTNGDRTDTIAEHIAQGHCYRHALNTRKFEPDGPNWTPGSPAWSATRGRRVSPPSCPSSKAPTAAATTASGISSIIPASLPGRAASSTPTRATATPCPPSRASPGRWNWVR